MNINDIIGRITLCAGSHFIEGERVTFTYNGRTYTRRVNYCRADGLYIWFNNYKLFPADFKEA